MTHLTRGTWRVQNVAAQLSRSGALVRASLVLRVVALGGLDESKGTWQFKIAPVRGRLVKAGSQVVGAGHGHRREVGRGRRKAMARLQFFRRREQGAGEERETKRGRCSGSEILAGLLCGMGRSSAVTGCRRRGNQKELEDATSSARARDPWRHLFEQRERGSSR